MKDTIEYSEDLMNEAKRQNTSVISIKDDCNHQENTWTKWNSEEKEFIINEMGCNYSIKKDRLPMDFLSYVSDKPVRIVLINKKYCLNGKLDLKNLLYYLDYEPNDNKFISDKLALIRKLETEPSLFLNCHNPNECYFLEHCYKEEKE